MGWASYSFMFPEHIWEFLDDLDYPDGFLASLIENSKEYKDFVSSHNISQDRDKDEPSLFDNYEPSLFD